jgi:hypothetical protein
VSEVGTSTRVSDFFVRLVRAGRSSADDAWDIAAELSAAGQLAFEHAYFRQRSDSVEGVVFVLSDNAVDAQNSVRDVIAQLIGTSVNISGAWRTVR